MGALAILVGLFVAAVLSALPLVVLETLSRGRAASTGEAGEASPFSVPGEDAAVAGASADFPDDLGWAFRSAGILDRGWAAVKAHPVPLILGGVILTVLDTCNGNGGSGDLSDILDEIDTDADLGSVFVPSDHLAQNIPELDGWLLGGVVVFVAVLALVLAFSAVVSLIKSWIFVGWLQLHRDILLGGTSAVATLFVHRRGVIAVWLSRILAYVLYGLLCVAAVAPVIAAGETLDALNLPMGDDVILLAVGASFLLLAASMVYASLGLWLAPWFVVYDDSGPWHAILQSWDAARGNRVTLFVFAFTHGLVGLLAVVLGLLTCCVGLLVTLPVARAITDLSISYGWLSARLGDEAVEALHA